MSLLQEIERHMKRTGTFPARFGREAVRDPQLVFDMRRGREPGPRVSRRIRAYMAARP